MADRERDRPPILPTRIGASHGVAPPPPKPRPVAPSSQSGARGASASASASASAPAAPNAADDGPDPAAEAEDPLSARAVRAARLRLRAAPRFAAHRPRYHVLAPYGWMNDPCAPAFVPDADAGADGGAGARDDRADDAAQGEEQGAAQGAAGGARGWYHLFFQWNPVDHEWGNTSWGHYVSRDAVTWAPVTSKRARGSEVRAGAEATGTGAGADADGADAGEDGGEDAGEDGYPPELALKPEDRASFPHDFKGAFSGCMRVGAAEPAPSSSSSSSPSAAPAARTAVAGAGAAPAPLPLTLVYTAVSSLPIHYTLPYARGSEAVALARSADGGRTWARHDGGRPVRGAAAPPPHVDATAWRDPFVDEWPALAEALRGSEAAAAVAPCSAPAAGSADGAAPAPAPAPAPPLIGVVSGGLRSSTPTVFAYAVSACLTRWAYAGTLLRPGIHARPGTLTGDLAINWEVCNFVRLDVPPAPTTAAGGGGASDAADERAAPPHKQIYLLLSAEGTDPPPWAARHKHRRASSHGHRERERPRAPGGAAAVDGAAVDSDSAPSPYPRPNRRVLWLACRLRAAGERSGPDDEWLQIEACGALDYGCLYATNTFHDAANGKRVLWGWIPEEDIGEEGRAAQGWAGCLCVPRECFVQVTRGVVGSLFADPLPRTGLVQYDERAKTAQVLGIRPARQVAALRAQPDGRTLPPITVQRLAHAARSFDFDHGAQSVLTCPIYSDVAVGTDWELSLTVDLDTTDAPLVGLVIHHTEHLYTLISFERSHSLLAVVRTHSHTPPPPGGTPTNADTDSGPVPIFRIEDADPGATGIEPLRLRVFFDKSVLEVFANDRAAISTRVYCDSDAHRLALFASTEAAFSDLTLWNGMRSWQG